jgi:hypothetical protein
LRLALKDLAIILDTLGRLEQIHPDLKTQMLSELAIADGATVSALVTKWRTKLLDLEVVGEPVRTASLEQADKTRAHDQPATVERPVAGVSASEKATAAETEAARESTLTPEQLLDAMVRHARIRAGMPGPEAARARAELPLLELLRQGEREGTGQRSADPELSNRIAPAVAFALGLGSAGGNSRQEAIEALASASDRLSGPARMEARHLTFCKRIRGYGSVDPLDSPTFRAGQSVLLYSEVENFVSEPIAGGGFRSRLSSELELLDGQQQVVWRQEFSAVDDRSSVPRRDYFLSHNFRLPAQLRPGDYSLRLTLRDELACRSFSVALALVVR